MALSSRAVEGSLSCQRHPKAQRGISTSTFSTSGLPLAIGNASGQTFARRGISNRGVFDKEVRRKPLACAADAWSYGI